MSIEITNVCNGVTSWHVECCDVMTGLQHVPSNSVHCVAFSPPYYGLRDYKIPPSIWGGDPECEHEWADETVEREMRRGIGLRDSTANTRGGAKKVAEIPHQKFTHGFCKHCSAWKGCHGLEPTPSLYIRNAVLIYRELKRVLRPDGNLWINIGDSYATKPHGKSSTHDPLYPSGRNRSVGNRANRQSLVECKPKELIGIPWRLAFALSDDGWYRRAEVIWNKLAPMPESASDRPTRAHEQVFVFGHPDGDGNVVPCLDDPNTVFLMSRSGRYFYDAVASSEECTGNAHSRGNGVNPKASEIDDIGDHHGVPKQNPSFSAAVNELVERRNMRTVWSLGPESYKGAHFAVMPTELARKILVAGTSEKGCCPRCGAPWVRVVEKERLATRPASKTKVGRRMLDGHLEVGNRDPERHMTASRTIGWEPTCKCGIEETIPCLVLDPFNGHGTTGVVARRLGLRYIGLEVNPEYAKASRKRIKNDQPMTN